MAYSFSLVADVCNDGMKLHSFDLQEFLYLCQGVSYYAPLGLIGVCSPESGSYMATSLNERKIIIHIMHALLMNQIHQIMHSTWT